MCFFLVKASLPKQVCFHRVCDVCSASEYFVKVIATIIFKRGHISLFKQVRLGLWAKRNMFKKFFERFDLSYVSYANKVLLLVFIKPENVRKQFFKHSLLIEISDTFISERIKTPHWRLAVSLC